TLHKLGRSALRPRIVCLRQAHTFVERRMIVEPEFDGGRGLRFLEIDFAEDLERVRRHNRSVGNQSVDYLEAVLVSLMLEVTAIGVRNGSEEEPKDHGKKNQGRQDCQIVLPSNRPRLAPAREHPVQQAIRKIEKK